MRTLGLGLGDGGWVVDVAAHGLYDEFVDAGCWDLRGVAVVAAFGAAAGVVIPLVDGVTVKWSPTPRTDGETAQQPGGGYSSGVQAQVRVGNVCVLCAGVQDALYAFPKLGFDDRFAVALDYQVLVMQRAFVDRIPKKCDVGVGRAIQTSGELDLLQAFALGGHHKGPAHEFEHGGVGNPLVQEMRLFVAPVANGDRFAHKSARGRSWDAAVAFDDVAQAAADFLAQLFEEYLVLEVEEVLVQFPELIVGDIVGERVNDIAEAAQVCFVVLAFIRVSAETGEAPDNQACLARAARAEVSGHAQEFGATDDAGAWLCIVAENLADDQPALQAPAFEFADLARDREVLVIAA